jgi:hypothetical protein
MSSPIAVKHILSPSPKVPPKALIPPKNLIRGFEPKRGSPGGVELLVFDILNIFCRQWFLSWGYLLANVISAQKAEDGNISWVEFTSQYHSHLVKCAVALVPHPILVVKKVMFVYILELLNWEGHMAFFKLQKGGCKANNAQKEKQCLAWKWSHAAKQEREWEAAKAAKLPPCEWQCMACGHKFKSCKTASKHKCPKSKVVHVAKEAATGQASQATPTARLSTPAAPLTCHTPTTLTNTMAIPPVTRDLGDSGKVWVQAILNPNFCRQLLWEELEHYLAMGTWTFLGPVSCSGLVVIQLCLLHTKVGYDNVFQAPLFGGG